MFKKLLNYLGNGERYQTIAVSICVFLTLAFLSCESKVPSLTNPNIKINRDELQNEIEYFIAKAETKMADLNQQDALKKILLDHAVIAAQTGTINPLGILTTFAGIVGIGATVDNIRKRKLLKNITVTYEKDPEPSVT